jgi:hypothetical protein
VSVRQNSLSVAHFRRKRALTRPADGSIDDVAHPEHEAGEAGEVRAVGAVGSAGLHSNRDLAELGCSA